NFIPIGKPVANTQIYILDTQLNLQPVGIPGELYIGGVQVGKGYYNRIELSSEKFIKYIFSKDKNAKLYKTGDLVRYMTDGNIEYLGRIDNQIKIRGFRIELGEIEFVLNNYPGIKEAIVIAKEIKKGDKRLISFIVSEKGKEVSVNDIRNFLKIKLPEYMIPSQIILLDELPLSLNGKVDRNKLSAYEFSRDELQTEYKEATVPVEEILVRIWKNILAVDKIGVNDNFFELGGDSIISIQIISQAIQNGLRITPKQIFQYQTIAELASVIEYSAPVILNQNEVKGDIPLTPVQHWFFEHTSENPDKFNHSVLLKVPSGLNENALEETMSMILKHHDALRLRFVKEEKIWKQNNSEFKKENIFSVKDFSQIKDSLILKTELRLNINENQESLSLENGPLIKSILYKLGTGEDRLLIIVHHTC
ncbi:MAG: AMP-binding protein, partial [Ignavibacteria bacterium]|nr:AMP-binding protein [Ignavibacteria bacterium]